MSKYKVGDKIILTVTGMTEMGGYPFYVLNDNNFILFKQSIEEHAEPLSTYTEPLAENKKLKEENEKILIKIDVYELYGDQHEEEYNQAFGSQNPQTGGRDYKAANQGADKAWELARKILNCDTCNGISVEKRQEIFDTVSFRDILNKNTYSEAAAKVKAWEKAKEEIEVGDIITHEEYDKDLCVMCISPDKKHYNAVDGYGAVYYMLSKEKIAKTGRHIDIDGFLKQIGGEE